MPADEQTILRYIAYLISCSVSPRSFQVHLSAIRSLHIMQGYDAPPINAPRVKLAVKAAMSTAPPVSQKSPITIDILAGFLELLKVDPLRSLWAAVFTTAFFGALRGGEYAIQFISGIGWTVPLALSAVQIYHHKDLLVARLTIPKTKTSDQGRVVTLGCSKSPICAPCALLEFISTRSNAKSSDPLFAFPSGTPLTKNELNKKIQSLASTLGIDKACMSSHSFRSGAATVASNVGFNEAELKHLGGWNSQAYQGYIRHNSTSHTFAARMVHSSVGPLF